MKVYLGRYPKDSSKERKVSIRIDKWDAWNVDHTLSLIIHPLLVQLKKTKQGAPFTDDEDVPEHLRSTSAKPKENDRMTDEFHFDRFNWILGEMIWTFSELATTEEEDACYTEVELEESETNPISKMLGNSIKVDRERLNARNDRVTNGLRLFGKYFQALWD